MLLDSNILIYGGKAEHPVLDQILDRTDLAAASITCIETLGYHKLSAVERHWLEEMFKRMKVLPLSDAMRLLERQERAIGLADAIIASTALVHGLPLVTRNTDDFKNVAGLTLLDPFT